MKYGTQSIVFHVIAGKIAGTVISFFFVPFDGGSGQPGPAAGS